MKTSHRNGMGAQTAGFSVYITCDIMTLCRLRLAAFPWALS
jgi:hypothetical protein